ncbi:MAG: phage minor head protein, partial [Methylococcaceae bacterium]
QPEIVAGEPAPMPEPMDAEPEEDDTAVKLMKHDLSNWKRKAIKNVGTEASWNFVSDYIPDGMTESIRFHLQECKTADDVTSVFRKSLALKSVTINKESTTDAPLTRDELERRLAKEIGIIERKYLRILEANGGILPLNFWIDYETELRQQIASPLRAQIEQSFTNYSDYVKFIDQAGAVGDIDTAMTRAINEVARGVSENSRLQFEALVRQGVSPDEIIERMALRFSSGHAEQIAVTELTRAEAQFSEALSSRLSEQGVESQIRWLTSEDERVCPICWPLDHKLKKDGGWMSKGGMIAGPPAHPNCRCQTVVELPTRRPSG